MYEGYVEIRVSLSDPIEVLLLLELKDGKTVFKRSMGQTDACVDRAPLILSTTARRFCDRTILR